MEKSLSVDERIRRLEQSNARLKGCVVGFGVVALALGLVGATAPGPKTISAERFDLVDSAGRTRAELSANDKSAALQFVNTDGSRALFLASGDSANALYVADRKGQPRIVAVASDDGTATFSLTKKNAQNDPLSIIDSSQGTVLSVHDPNGMDRVVLGYTAKGASVLVNDANGTTRAAAGEQGFASFKKGGQIEWASFGENMTPEERKQVMDLVNSVPQKNQ